MEDKKENLFWEIIKALPDLPEDGRHFWQNGDEILCDSSERAEAVADLIGQVIGDTPLDTCTGYYDPEEDERNNEVDACTGFFYVHLE